MTMEAKPLLLTCVRLCLWWCLCGLFQAQATAGVRAQDDKGQPVVLARPAQRVVSLVPSATEVVCALGACGRLVAVDRWSNWPASVKALPRVGGMDDPNVELIALQQPDLVLVAPASRVAARLRSLGFAVAEVDTRDLEGVQRVLAELGVLLGREQAAKEVWLRIDKQIAQERSNVPAAAVAARVYVEVSASPHAAGPQSFIGQLITRLGGRNIVPDPLGAFPVLTPEFIVRADPDLIIVSTSGVQAMTARPGWAKLRAVRDGLICAVPPDDYDVLVRPGPRLGEAAGILARCFEKAKKTS